MNKLLFGTLAAIAKSQKPQLINLAKTAIDQYLSQGYDAFVAWIESQANGPQVSRGLSPMDFTSCTDDEFPGKVEESLTPVTIDEHLVAGSAAWSLLGPILLELGSRLIRRVLDRKDNWTI